jgi:DNA repair protein RadD
MKLRPYQNALVEAARCAFAEGHRRILIQLPTGGGKTVILSELARVANLKNSPFLVMAHRIEIVDQISEKLTIFGLSPSIVASGRPSSSTQINTVVAMQQTLVRRLDSVQQPKTLCIDEAHHTPATGYQKIIDEWPGTIVIGLTATPCRLDGKPLKECFDHMVIGPSVRELIAMECLAEFTYLAPPTDPKLAEDLKKMKKRGGDYAKGELATAVSTKKIIGDVVDHYREFFNGKTVIAFCVSVDHAQVVAQAFQAAGFRAGDVHGGMGKPERDAVIEEFRRGALSILTTCDLIGEGFDVPDCSGALLLRPTQSLTIFLQQCGRALRPKSDGSKAVILDHVGNCYRHGRPDDEREWSLDVKVKAHDVEIKQCPKCFVVLDPLTFDLSNGCPSGAYPAEDCAYLAAVEAGTESEVVIEHIDGKLIEYVAPVKAEWAGELDLKSSTGQEYSRLLRAAGDDIERLAAIAKARNYKSSWPYVRIAQVHAMRKKYARAQ